MYTCADCTKDEGVAPLECKRHRVCSGCLVKRSQQNHPTSILKCRFCKSTVKLHVQRTAKIVPESYKAALESPPGSTQIQPMGSDGASKSANHHSDP